MDDEPLDGATPVDADEASDLIPTHIQTRGELNQWEQANILQAAQWVGRARTPALSEKAIRELHRRMFDRTWSWAGQYRRSDKNIGVHWPTIGVEVRNLIDDAKYWFEHATYSVDEAAARLHHRLVKVHPFPNGNGRHARLWCDMLLRQNGRPVFEWHGAELEGVGSARRAYLSALRAADAHDYGPLLELLLRGRS